MTNKDAGHDYTYGCKLGFSQSDCTCYVEDQLSRGRLDNLGGCPSCKNREPANETTRERDRVYGYRIATLPTHPAQEPQPDLLNTWDHDTKRARALEPEHARLSALLAIGAAAAAVAVELRKINEWLDLYHSTEH